MAQNHYASSHYSSNHYASRHYQPEPSDGNHYGSTQYSTNHYATQHYHRVGTEPLAGGGGSIPGSRTLPSIGRKKKDKFRSRTRDLKDLTDLTKLLLLSGALDE